MQQSSVPDEHRLEAVLVAEGGSTVLTHCHDNFSISGSLITFSPQPGPQPAALPSPSECSEPPSVSALADQKVEHNDIPISAKKSRRPPRKLWRYVELPWQVDGPSSQQKFTGGPDKIIESLDCARLELVRSLGPVPAEEVAIRKAAQPEQDMTCPICLEDMSSSDVVMTKCNHCFHSACAQTSENISTMQHWHWACPSCRDPITYVRTRGFKMDRSQTHDLDTLPGTSEKEQLNRFFKRAPSLVTQVSALLMHKTWTLGVHVRECPENASSDGTNPFILAPAVVAISIDADVVQSEIAIDDEGESSLVLPVLREPIVRRTCNQHFVLCVISATILGIAFCAMIITVLT
mmetsp:Transcript_23696/g.37028  ORF Transcript_23696/g.37028 Transcript_23696/m.37028 type:complete len:349 (+) Transcript_23696:108-1154(+)